MTQPASKNPLKHLRASDLRGVAQLATQATVGVAHIAEGVHQSVWRTLGMPGAKAPGQARGVTGLIYQSVRSVTQLLGQGLQTVLAKLEPVLEAAEGAAPESSARALQLNGSGPSCVVSLMIRPDDDDGRNSRGGQDGSGAVVPAAGVMNGSSSNDSRVSNDIESICLRVGFIVGCGLAVMIFLIQSLACAMPGGRAAGMAWFLCGFRRLRWPTDARAWSLRNHLCSPADHR